MTEFLALFAQPETYVSLVTLTFMEIVLGVDNVIFISIIAGKLPQAEQGRARALGLLVALFLRIGLLLCIGYIVKLTNPFFTVLNHGVSGRDLILLLGGLFLVFKSTIEIHGKLEGHGHSTDGRAHPSFWKVVFQIMMLDVVFSFDSVITAVGLVQEIPIMIIAILISLVVMLVFSGAISSFIEKHPTFKMLALSFLLMIGTMLIAEGVGVHFPRGYIYFAMAFSVVVELLNMKVRHPPKLAQ